MIHLAKFDTACDYLLCPLCDNSQEASHSPVNAIVSWKCNGCGVRICLPEYEKVVRRLHPEDDNEKKEKP